MSDRQEPERQAPKPPPASFLGLVEMFVSQAYMGMGGVQDPKTGKPLIELDFAKHAIDMLEVLENKTKGNLTAPERNYLENVLYELRMRFVRVSQNPPEVDATPDKADAPEPEPAESGETAPEPGEKDDG
ncbi:DUF1844 domain-containing protein [Candidatus Poribacteria bacterium]|nr:DUF1844 domain-containing protein [Candidatus Poribacteria bacterium]